MLRKKIEDGNVRVGAPEWRSHTPRCEIAGRWYGEAVRCVPWVSNLWVVEGESDTSKWCDECVVGGLECTCAARASRFAYMAEPLSCIGVIPVRWEGKYIVQEIFVGLSFSFVFALSCSFSKTFDGSFHRLLVGAFIGAFLEAFGVVFSFAFVFCLRCEDDRKAYLSLYSCEHSWWGSMAFILLLEGIVRDGLLSGSAAALEGWVRADPEGSSGKTCITWTGVERANWVRNSGRWQVDLKTKKLSASFALWNNVLASEPPPVGPLGVGRWAEFAAKQDCGIV